MSLAVLRPGSWNLPLFLHVLGATTLFGALIVVLALTLAARRSNRHAAPLARSAFRAWLVVVVPTFVLMRVAAQWILDREEKQLPQLDDKGWVGVGFSVGDGGVVFLLLIGIAAWLHARRNGTGRAGIAATVLSSVYLVALGVAWFAMSAKPGG
jgi:high-affinity nickel permease